MDKLSLLEAGMLAYVTLASLMGLKECPKGWDTSVMTILKTQEYVLRGE